MPSPLEQLITATCRARGMEVPSEEAWRGYVEHVVETLDVGPGASVFDAACGAGAFLYPLWENGYIVGGLDRSPDLVAAARAGLPDGRFDVGGATTLDPAEPWDVVLACGAFESGADPDQVRGVLSRMAAKATHAIAILDVLDPPTDGRMTPRIDRAWMLRTLAEIGATAVQFGDATLTWRRASRPRFNVFARI